MVKVIFWVFELTEKGENWRKILNDDQPYLKNPSACNRVLFLITLWFCFVCFFFFGGGVKNRGFQIIQQFLYITQNVQWLPKIWLWNCKCCRNVLKISESNFDYFNNSRMWFSSWFVHDKKDFQSLIQHNVLIQHKWNMVITTWPNFYWRQSTQTDKITEFSNLPPLHIIFYFLKPVPEAEKKKNNNNNNNFPNDDVAILDYKMAWVRKSISWPSRNIIHELHTFESRQLCYAAR